MVTVFKDFDVFVKISLKEDSMYKNIKGLSFAQISRFVELKVPTLNARTKTLFKDEELMRGKTNKVLLKPEQVKTVINDQINDCNGKVIYIGNLKGGVGKTTIAYLLADTVSSLGFKTCAVDLDVQANLTQQFMEAKVEQPTFCDVIDNKINIKDIIINIAPTLDLIPSSLKNGIIQKSLLTQAPKHYLTWLNSLCLTYLRSKYDIIIVDTPPSLTTLNSVFCLCLKNNDHLVIPACADEFSIVGIGMFLEDVNLIRKSYKTTSKPKTSIIMNRFHQNQTINLQMFVKMSKTYEEFFSKIVIKDLAKIREVTSNKTSISETKHSSELFEILAELLKEFNIVKTVS